MPRRPREDPERRPRRRLGQNFLVDRNVAERLVATFAPRRPDTVVEIGPGRGALTPGLAARSGRFVALELDERWLEELRALVRDVPHAEIRHADALEVDWDALARELGTRDLRVVGNLPYNVGTAIVRRLLACDSVFDVQVMLQAEVAGRILARPGTRAYGPLTIVAALRAERRRLFDVGAGAFRPRPKVRSTVIALRRLETPPLPAPGIPDLERWLFAGFGQRRKTLAGNLRDARERVQRFLEEHGLPRDARAEAVPPETWLALARELGPSRGAPSV